MNTTSLATLLGLVPIQSFIRDHLEKAPLHVSRCGGTAPLFSVGDIERVLRQQRPWESGRLSLVSNGGGFFPLASLVDCHDPIGTERAIIEQLCFEGATVVFNGLEHRWAPIASLVADIRTTLGCRAHCNVYCTPPGARGFTTHSDTHDVMIVQTAGRKRWRLFEVCHPLPLDGQDARYLRRPTLMPSGKSQAEPTDELELAPGDFLYLPRGVPHQAAAVGDEVSIHLTIGLHPYRIHELFKDLVDDVALDLEVLRRRVPEQGFPNEPAALMRWLALQFDEATATGTSLPTREQLMERSSSSWDRLPEPGRRITSWFDAAELDLASCCRHPCAGPPHWETVDGQVRVWADTRQVHVPARAEDAVRFIVSTSEFAVADLPDTYSDRAKVLLCRRLVERGLLETRPSSPEGS